MLAACIVALFATTAACAADAPWIFGTIMCIYTDRHGDLWLAGNGVFKFNGVSFDRIH
jgi:hypothetical protein